MTRKDYVLLATALNFEYRTSLDHNNPSSNPQIIMQVADQIACRLATDNPRFNREHFLAVVRGDKSLTSRPSRNGVQS